MNTILRCSFSALLFGLATIGGVAASPLPVELTTQLALPTRLPTVHVRATDAPHRLPTVHVIASSGRFDPPHETRSNPVKSKHRMRQHLCH